MAKVTSLFKVKGAIGDTVFRDHNGKTIASMKGPYDKERWRKNENGARSHENAQEFGGAAKAGSAVYRALRNSDTEDIFLPYAHNHIAKRLRTHAPRVLRAAHEYTFKAAIPALHGLDLSQVGSAGRNIRLTPIGPCHRPEAVQVKGLRQAAQAIGNLDTLRLEFRITRKAISFPEIHFNHDTWEWNYKNSESLEIHSHTTPWIPIEHVQKDGLTLALSHPERSEELRSTSRGPLKKDYTEQSSKQPTVAEQSEGAKSSPRELPSQNDKASTEELVFLIIEWRQMRGKKKPKLLPNHGMIRLAAIRTTLEQAQEMAIQGIQTPKPTKRYKKQPPRIPIQRFKHKNPAQFMKSALQGILYQPPT
jgi:hypothetical protein